jgi:hypothetical protein
VGGDLSDKSKTANISVVVAEMNIPGVVGKRATLPGGTAQTLERYSEMLDLEPYRQIKALREAQGWRLAALETAPLEADTVAFEPRAALVAV